MYNQIDSNKRKTFLLIAVFIAVVVSLGWLFSYLTEYGYSGLIAALIIAIMMSFFGYYNGDKVALWTAGAKGPIRQTDNPYLYRIIENLSITGGLPIPKIYIIPDKAINAFATGRDPQHSSVAVTLGAIEKLENEELEGVVAHELSHVKNYDIRLMTIVIVLIGIIALVSDWMLRSFFWQRRREHKDNRLGLIILIAGIVLAVLSPLIGRLIQFAISRRREYLADASGALLTRYPEGLARALEKISRENAPMQRANHATAHLYISNPFGKTGRFLANAFSTHPPIEERIKILRKM